MTQKHLFISGQSEVNLEYFYLLSYYVQRYRYGEYFTQTFNISLKFLILVHYYLFFGKLSLAIKPYIFKLECVRGELIKIIADFC